MIPRLRHVIAAAVLAGGLAACAEEPPSRPAFYTDLSRGGSSLDRVDASQTINLFRANNGLTPVALDERLNALAEAYARDLADAAKRGEAIKPDGKLKQRLAGNGYEGAVARENVSAGYHTFAEAFSGWRESRQHRETMLMPGAATMGIAAVNVPGTKYRVYWVLILAKP
ncbi:MAG: CAP domain-containing protein [Flavobacteriaceae bacterium]